jgi:signal transduction histidine kinase
MRERMEQMGGSFSLRTRPGSGATVVATLPRPCLSPGRC